ncbi:MAG TPA: PAS domain S-box protein [Edaphobacter sp.]|nr:PAS domain S-box protein [Edaphobacter sp.]
MVAASDEVDDVLEIDREVAVRESEARLTAELADAKILQRLSTELIPEQQPEALYNKILDAAMELMKADAASLQMLEPLAGELYLLASRNLHPKSRDYWQKVSAQSVSTCGKALKDIERIVIMDVEADSSFAGTQELEEYRRSNIRACQSTPLVSRAGHILGMISTHWSKPHQPEQSEFAHFDVLARQAADLIERAQTETALRESEQLFRAVFEQSAEGIALTDLTGRFMMVNECYCNVVGRSQEELLTMNKLDLTAPADLEESRRLLHALAAGGPNFVIEKRYVKPDGSLVWVRNHISAIRSQPEGPPERLITITTDITERKNTQLALKESEERFRVIVENVREYALVQTDSEYRITNWNPGAERMFGYRSEEVLGRSFELLLTSEEKDAGLLSRELGIVEEKGRNEDARWFVRKDGARIWTRWVTEAIRDEKGKIVALTKVLRDETERLKRETSMRQSEKLAVVGRLASSIAHEINNPLEAVTNLVYLARQNATSTATQEYLELAERELRRVSHITTETLRFHRQASRPARTDIVELLESVLLLHEGRLRSGHIVTERRYSPYPSVICLANEIRQVLANLIGNAIDAMVSNGIERQLKVRVRRGFDPEGGEGVRILISDTGSGVSRQSRKHLFEPFFTTKASTGTGLGLWVSAEIVKKHHGKLRFRSRVSQPHRGTVFSLFLSSRTRDEKAD